MSVLLIAAIGVAFVLLAILVFRLHPVIALLLSSLFLLVVTPVETRMQNELQPFILEVVRATTAGEIGLRKNVSEGRYACWTEDSQLESASSIWLTPISRPLSTLLPEPAAGDSAQQASGERLVWYHASAANGVISSDAKIVTASQYKTAQLSRFSRLGSELTRGFTKTFSKLGIPVTMAAIVGACLLESGAAAKLVSLIIALFGRRGTAPALTFSGFILGVPVYFDNVFYLLLPLAKAVGRKRPEMFLSAVMAIIVGATMAHSLVPPTPGPLLVADAMGVSIGMMMVGGLVVGSAAAAAGFAYGMLCGRWVHFTDEQIARSLAEEDPGREDSASTAAHARRIPPLWLAGLPIAFPITVLAGSELLQYFLKDSASPALLANLSAINNPSLVFIVTALIAVGLLRGYASAKTVSGSVAKAISDAGTIVLLTCSGGAFGAALQQLGLADAIASGVNASSSAWGLLVIAFALTTIIRAAQGSATVAMITSAGVVSQMMPGDLMALPYHPIYIALAIGCGSKPLPWMNDSGFWQVATMTGMTPIQTLKSFSAALTLMGLTGFAVTLLGAWLLPLV